MIANQLGRRNLENIDKVPLLERKREIVAKAAKGRQIRKPADSVSVNLPEQTQRETRDTLAAEIGVSGKTYEALGRRYNRTKKTKAEAGAIGGKASKSQNATCLDTAAKLAEEHSVHRATVERAGQFAAAETIAKETSPNRARGSSTTATIFCCGFSSARPARGSNKQTAQKIAPSDSPNHARTGTTQLYGNFPARLQSDPRAREQHGVGPTGPKFAVVRPTRAGATPIAWRPTRPPS